jgi:hypothetical protein
MLVPVSVATSGATADASPAFNSTTTTRATDVSTADGSFPDLRLDSSDSAGLVSATTDASLAFDYATRATAVSAAGGSFPDLRLDSFEAAPATTVFDSTARTTAVSAVNKSFPDVRLEKSDSAGTACRLL